MKVDLSGRNLTTDQIQEELAQYDNSKITKLNLSDNRITNFSGDYPKLTGLYLRGNGLTNFSGDYPELAELYLQGNELTSFSGNYPELINLDLSGNSLVSFSGNYPKLNELALCDNYSIDLLGDCPKLTKLYIWWNDNGRFIIRFAEFVEKLYHYMNNVMFSNMNTMIYKSHQLNIDAEYL